MQSATRLDSEGSEASSRATIRHDWTREEIRELYEKPFADLLFEAQTVHRRYHDPNSVQRCTLLSVKTGGCPEDCGYCSQSAHHETGLKSEPLMEVEKVVAAAREARAAGSSRFCMGAAWREVKDGESFDAVCEMVRRVNDLGLESCVTLGMLNDEQARRLKEAGLVAYNHNLDTSREYYDKVVSTRNYEDRLRTLESVRRAGITVCCGGILGLGEEVSDRIGLLQELARLEPHPESVPINALAPVGGTPLEGSDRVSALEMVRAIATARILMPQSMVRLSAGRTAMTPEAQALCFLAGANSIFAGDRLLTTPNPDEDTDAALFDALGVRALEPALPCHGKDS